MTCSRLLPFTTYIEMKHTVIVVEPDLQLKFKTKALARGVTLKAASKEAITDWMRKETTPCPQKHSRKGFAISR